MAEKPADMQRALDVLKRLPVTGLRTQVSGQIDYAALAEAASADGSIVDPGAMAEAFRFLMRARAIAARGSRRSG